MKNTFLTKEKKKEYKSAKRFFGAEFVKLIIIVLILVFVGGGASLLYKTTVERQEINIARENFEQSKSRLHGLADDLAKYKYELATEENAIARKAMIEMIIDRTSSLNVNDLENPSLRQFVKDVRNGKYN